MTRVRAGGQVALGDAGHAVRARPRASGGARRLTRPSWREIPASRMHVETVEHALASEHDPRVVDVARAISTQFDVNVDALRAAQSASCAAVARVTAWCRAVRPRFAVAVEVLERGLLPDRLLAG